MKAFGLDELQVLGDISGTLGEVLTALEKTPKDPSWPDQSLLKIAVEESTKDLNKSLQTLEKQTGSLLSSAAKGKDYGEGAQKVFHAWDNNKNPPPLLSLCLYAFEKTGLKPDETDLAMLIMMSILGQIKNDLPYHSDMHFRKVVAQVGTMIVAHQNLHRDRKYAFSAKQMCMLLGAACIHDLDHDGKGNVIKGLLIPGRAEKRAFMLAEPYMEAVGVDEKTLNEILVMILSTDVLPLNDPTNSVQQMKAAYRYHFMGENKGVYALNLSEELSAMESNPYLTLMSLILHEADISTSAALTYEVTKYETALLMDEYRRDHAYPEDVVNFLEQICDCCFLTEVGKVLYQQNIEHIYACAKADFENGNKPYPTAQASDYLK